MSDVWDITREREVKTEVPVTSPHFQTLSQGQLVWESSHRPLLPIRPSNRWRCSSFLGLSCGKLNCHHVYEDREHPIIYAQYYPHYINYFIILLRPKKKLLGFLSNTPEYFTGMGAEPSFQGPGVQIANPVKIPFTSS